MVLLSGQRLGFRRVSQRPEQYGRGGRGTSDYRHWHCVEGPAAATAAAGRGTGVTRTVTVTLILVTTSMP